MAVFELTIALLLVGAMLALWADRIGVPYPALLALAGAVLALIPGTPQVTLDPELALALFVAPVLVDAAYDASPAGSAGQPHSRHRARAGGGGLTIAAVALVARYVVPEMPWAAAIALGAIVAPPDASAATAVLRKLRPPHRLMVILEGESLFNDASALLAYRIAVGAAITGTFSGWSLLPMLLLTCGGGVIFGIVLARAYLWVSSGASTNLQVSIVLQFIGTFAVWILAERIGLVRDHHHGRLCDDGSRASRRDASGGRARISVLRGVGRGRVRDERARVRTHRPADARHRRAHPGRRVAHVSAQQPAPSARP